MLDVESQEGQVYNLGFFITIFGLEVQLDKLEDESQVERGLFHLRLLGNAHQSTHLTLHYGVRRWDYKGTQSEFENNFWGAEMSIYLFKNFGFRGMYRSILEAEADDGRLLKGQRTEAGLFIEALFLRVYGNWYTEPMELETTGSTQEFTRKGLEAGVMFFF